jgi:hypothetical protein
LREARANHSQGEFTYHTLLNKDIEIADICLAYHNGELIKLLQQRGSFIAYNKFDKIRECDEKIKALLDNPKNAEQLIKPSAAFIIFGNDDSFRFATDLADKEKKEAKNKDSKLARTKVFPNTLNQNLRLLKASEPTDIIWENRAFSDWDHTKREIIAYIVIGVLLGAIFYLTFMVAFQSA